MKTVRNSSFDFWEPLYLISVPTLWASVIAMACHSWMFLAIWWAVYLPIVGLLVLINMRSTLRKVIMPTRYRIDEWQDEEWWDDYENAVKQLDREIR
jgi:hypothetical protein